MARQEPKRWTLKILRPWRHMRSIGRPQKRWLCDMKITAGTNWFQVIQYQSESRKVKKVYIQQWIANGREEEKPVVAFFLLLH